MDLLIFPFKICQGDGELDDQGLKQAIAAGCDTSQTTFEVYLAQTGTDPSVPRMPNGPEDFPILVELRFEPGRYDLADGLFQTDELVNCSHLLLNGQNVSITSHLKPGVTAGAVSPAGANGRTVNWLFAPKGSDYVALLDFVFGTAIPATTMGRIKSVERNASGVIVSMGVAIRADHASWQDQPNGSWFTTLQPVTEDGAFDIYGGTAIGHNSHYGGWPGMTTELCGADCMRVSPSSLSVLTTRSKVRRTATISPWVRGSGSFGARPLASPSEYNTTA